MADRRPPRLGFLLAIVAGLSACGAAPSDHQAKTPAPPTRATTSASAPAPTARAAAQLRLVRVGGFSSPVYVAAPPGDRDRIFVVEQGGRIQVLRHGRRLSRPFLDISDEVRSGGEQGLLSMAFAPDYATSGRFYVDYTDRDGNTHVSEFRRSGDPDRALGSSERLVLFQRQPEPNHNGGLVLFGPDGLLYIGFGDGGGADDHHGARGNAQNLGTVLGKLLRIDPRASGGRAYTVPRDNPFAGRRGARPEIYDYGLRNPWRFTFDRGNLVIADVGQDHVEEIDFAPRGRTAGLNFGWRVWEGRSRNFPGERAPRAVFPVFTYSHSGGRCSITGGVVVRDSRLRGYVGSYLYGDFCGGPVRSVRLRAGGACCDRSVGVQVGGLSSFGEDARRRVYVTSLDGAVYRLDPR
jgi:glucose/arabinose dehydrogenase